MRISWPERRQRAVQPSRLSLSDLAAESLAGILQRPGRSALTMFGTVLGIGTFVAVLGLSATANGQISKQFTVLDATQVTVTDSGAAHATTPVIDFPAAADADAQRIHGVIAAGVWWQVGSGPTDVARLPGSGPAAGLQLPVYAASPGLLRASGAILGQGVFYSSFDESRDQPVAILSASTASQLGISDLQDQPAIFIQGQPFTVIGIIRGSPRLPQLGLGVMVPESVALRLWGPAQPAQPAQMLIHTRLGAAQAVALQAAVALRPDRPEALTATTPLNPTTLAHAVQSSLASLLLALAAVAVTVGAIGIANTTLVAVMERASEIGLRRALGARPVHIAAQFLAESAGLGLFGGLIGTALGVLLTLVVTIYHGWTAILPAGTIIVSPLAGAIIGLLAGLYPALRASSLEPAAALRR
jgi:putative ABC transport system permease protein